MKQVPEVFVSFENTNLEMTRGLIIELKKRGIPAFGDFTEIESGAQLARIIHGPA